MTEHVMLVRSATGWQLVLLTVLESVMAEQTEEIVRDGELLTFVSEDFDLFESQINLHVDDPTEGKHPSQFPEEGVVPC